MFPVRSYDLWSPPGTNDASGRLRASAICLESRWWDVYSSVSRRTAEKKIPVSFMTQRKYLRKIHLDQRISEHPIFNLPHTLSGQEDF